MLKVETRRLRTALSQDELVERAQELASVIQRINTEVETQTTIKNQMKARMSELHGEQNRLALVVDRREDIRDVEVTILFDGSKVQEVRKDTGEVILVRPLRDAERQVALEDQTPAGPKYDPAQDPDRVEVGGKWYPKDKVPAGAP